MLLRSLRRALTGIAGCDGASVPDSFAKEDGETIRRKKLVRKHIDYQPIQLRFRNRDWAITGRTAFDLMGRARVIAISIAAFPGAGTQHHLFLMRMLGEACWKARSWRRSHGLYRGRIFALRLRPWC